LRGILTIVKERNEMDRFFVSRQLYWHTGDKVVEVAGGGADYCNPDMLCEKWANLGEGCEFDSPVDAVEAAICVRDAWKETGVDCRVELVYTGGYTMYGDENPTDLRLRRWALVENRRIQREIDERQLEEEWEWEDYAMEWEEYDEED
jgi:hypothetical protein